jgi:hypothetical protein
MTNKLTVWVARDSQVGRDERGKPAYTAILQFTDRPTSDAVSERAVAALPEVFPHAYDEEAVS